VNGDADAPPHHNAVPHRHLRLRASTDRCIETIFFTKKRVCQRRFCCRKICAALSGVPHCPHVTSSTEGLPARAFHEQAVHLGVCCRCLEGRPKRADHGQGQSVEGFGSVEHQRSACTARLDLHISAHLPRGSWNAQARGCESPADEHVMYNDDLMLSVKTAHPFPRGNRVSLNPASTPRKQGSHSHPNPERSVPPREHSYDCGSTHNSL
jgi:hypothetical protein